VPRPATSFRHEPSVDGSSRKAMMQTMPAIRYRKNTQRPVGNSSRVFNYRLATMCSSATHISSANS
jgi:hypothetical protein